MPYKKELIYPIFLECCKYATDIFWENIFEDLAYAKAPYGTYISKQFLCSKQKNKEFVYKIEVKDPIVLYEDIYEILSSKIGIMSEKQRINTKSCMDSVSTSYTSWYDIKKKNTRERLIELYILNARNIYNLTIKDCKQLLDVINVSLILRIITGDDILYQNDAIESIKGISFTRRMVWIDFGLCEIKNQTMYTLVEDKVVMIDEWYKYLKSISR